MFLTRTAWCVVQEKELAKEMDSLSMGAQASSSAVGGAGGATDGVKKYNKSSFFDEISCDVLDKAAGEGREYKLNKFSKTTTFSLKRYTTRC